MNGRELARAVGISERQVYRWVRRKWLNPRRAEVGYWNGEEYSFNNHEIDVARRMAALVKAGFYPDAAHKIARGSHRAAERALHALSPCVDELRWRWHGAELAPETEPCG